MSSLQIQVEHISAGCNCTYNSFELTNNNFIVFGAQHSLAVYDLSEEKVVKTYVAHKGRINCVRYLKDLNNKWILTCGTDGYLIVWKQENSADSHVEPHVISKVCAESITVCDGIRLTDENNVLVGCISALSKVFLYNADLKEKTLVPVQEINMKLSVALDIIFHRLRNSDSLIVAFGMDNGSVTLYGKKEDNPVGADAKPSKTDTYEQKTILRKHEDWVRCISFFTLDDGDTLMATGGEDSFIAIWRFVADKSTVSEFEFQVHNFGSEKVVFESIIMGHEGWITSLHWNSRGNLLSCSSDQSTIIWENGENLWIEKGRFGAIGGQLPGGFGAKFNLNYLAVCGYQGAIQIWEYLDDNNEWLPRPSITGHFGPISDLDYNRGGQYIVTTSEDQTTRAHSPWGLDGRWHEISRPQIHGHDLFTVKTLGDFIVSGAEEKILRVFQPTDIFAKNLEDASEISADFLKHVVPAATLPALGLSNLSESVKSSEPSSDDSIETANISIESRLDEDFLRSHTLWPEVSKLYGHVYEIRVIATSPVDPLVASGSQSSRKEYSGIILWSAENWKKIDEYLFHNLNVTDMEFSPNGDRLLSASRDRTWALWQVNRNDGQQYSLQFLESGGFHTRALWVCTWHPSGNFFVTGARDKKLAVWTPTLPLDDSSVKGRRHQVAVHENFPASVSAAAINEDNLIAVGLENGMMLFYLLNHKIQNSARSLTLLLTLDNSLAHHDIVKRLKYNPKEKYQLASAGADHIFKVYQLTYSELTDT